MCPSLLPGNEAMTLAVVGTVWACTYLFAFFFFFFFRNISPDGQDWQKAI